MRAHDRQTARPAAGIPGAELAVGHHARVAQPHTTAEGPIADAEVVAAGIRSKEYPLGQPGPPLDGSSAFLTGMGGAAGVAVTAGLVVMIITVRGVLVLIGLALFWRSAWSPRCRCWLGAGCRDGRRCSPSSCWS
ncbi:MAG: hypothetical protein ACJ72I_13445 [Pseudonocardiaceae bacterium]